MDNNAAPAPSRGTSLGAVSVLMGEGRTRVVLWGVVDEHVNSELIDAFDEAIGFGGTVEVDTRNVAFMDSSAIALLAHAAARLPNRVTMIEPPDLVRFLLEVTQIGQVVNIIDHDPGFPDAPEVAAAIEE